MDLTVVIPAYNAASFVAERLTVLSAHLDGLGLDYEIIPVDDGSVDGTEGVLRGLAGPRLKPVLGAGHHGKFGALKRGVAAARGSCVLFTDADVPYELAAIRYFVGLVRDRGFHVAVGDRTLEGSSYAEQMPPLRAAATRAFSWLIRVLVTGGLHDTQCGFKAFRGDVARALFAMVREEGFAGDVEVLYIALKYNLEIRRAPIRLRHQAPTTVRPFRHGLGMLRSLLRVRRRHRRGEYASPELAAIARQDYWNHVPPPP